MNRLKVIIFALAMAIPSVTSAQTLDWAVNAGGEGGDVSRGVISSISGDIFIAGEFQDNATIGIGESTETNIDIGTCPSMFVAKYSEAGDFLWVRYATADSESTICSSRSENVLSDGESSVYVLGILRGAVTFGTNSQNADNA